MKNVKESLYRGNEDLLGRLNVSSYHEIRGVVPPQWYMRTAVDLLTHMYARPITIRGENNIADAVNLAKQNKKGIIFAPSHFSNADQPVLRKALLEIGFNDPDADLVAILGLRLYREQLTRLLTRSAPHIPVWPPTERPHTREELEFVKGLNTQALDTHRRVLDAGHNILLFPQGGRGNGKIEKDPHQGIAEFLTIPDSIIVPTIIIADTVLPKGVVMPIRGEVTAEFLKPLDGQYLMDQSGYNPESPTNAARQQMVGNVMTEIAAALPEERRGVFADRVLARKIH